MIIDVMQWDLAEPDAPPEQVCGRCGHTDTRHGSGFYCDDCDCVRYTDTQYCMCDHPKGAHRGGGLGSGGCTLTGCVCRMYQPPPVGACRECGHAHLGHSRCWKCECIDHQS